MGYTCGDPVSGTTRGRNGTHGDDTTGCVLHRELCQRILLRLWTQTLIYVLLCFLFSYTCQHHSLSPYHPEESLTGRELVYLEKGHADWENLSQNHQFPPSEVTVLPNGSANCVTPKTKTHKPFQFMVLPF